MTLNIMPFKQRASLLDAVLKLKNGLFETYNNNSALAMINNYIHLISVKAEVMYKVNCEI